MSIKNIIDALSAEDLLAEVRAVSDVWWDQNQDAVDGLGKPAVRALMTLVMLEKMPSTLSDPTLNLEKMRAASELANLSADHHEQIIKLRATLNDLVGCVVKRVLIAVVKASLLAMV